MIARLIAVCSLWLGMILLYIPLLTVAISSVNSSRYGMNWSSFSWRWYGEALADEAVLAATGRSLLLATLSTGISTILGAALALGVLRYAWGRRGRRILDTITFLPVVTPDLLLAASLVIAFALLQPLSTAFELGFTTMLIGHVTFQISFVAVVVGARLAAIGWAEQVEAARDLGADGSMILRRILLPQALPGLVAGALLAFTLSLDDFVISFFTKGGPDSTTLPIHIYASLRKGLHPSLRALSTMLFIVTVLLVLILLPLTARRRSTA